MLELRKQDARRKQGVLHREWHEKVFELGLGIGLGLGLGLGLRACCTESGTRR